MDQSVKIEMQWLNHCHGFDTTDLELNRGKWNSWCSGEMRRYQEERQRRSQLTGFILTLRNESVGSKQD